jgi:hypothetical protein
MPALTLFVAVATLVSPRLRTTIGDALAWSVDKRSRERVMRKLTNALQGVGTSRVVLIGHSARLEHAWVLGGLFECEV